MFILGDFFTNTNLTALIINVLSLEVIRFNSQNFFIPLNFRQEQQIMDAKLDIFKILTLLPQRYPFLLVDKIIRYEAGVNLSALKNVSSNEPFFQGHFPAEPVMPGVLILEAMAQTSGLLGFESAGGKPEGIICYLVGIDKAKFKRPVVPGDQLLIEVQFLKKKHNIWIYACQAYVDGEFVAGAEIRYATVLSNEN